VFDEGLTPIVIEGAVPLNAVPFDNVPVIVPVPVAAIVRLVLPPLQIIVVPLSTPVGVVLTVNAALPVLSAETEAQVPLVDEAMV
jgi:hypothetical protein